MTLREKSTGKLWSAKLVLGPVSGTDGRYVHTTILARELEWRFVAGLGRNAPIHVGEYVRARPLEAAERWTLVKASFVEKGRLARNHYDALLAHADFSASRAVGGRA